MFHSKKYKPVYLLWTTYKAIDNLHAFAVQNHYFLFGHLDIWANSLLHSIRQPMSLSIAQATI